MECHSLLLYYSQIFVHSVNINKELHFKLDKYGKYLLLDKYLTELLLLCFIFSSHHVYVSDFRWKLLPRDAYNDSEREMSTTIPGHMIFPVCIASTE